MSKTTATTILQEIGICALRDFIYDYLPSPDFHSHDFSTLFEVHFKDAYIQLQGLYARHRTIESRNGVISSQIGRFLGRHSDLLQIEKGSICRSMNMNGKQSPAHMWHKTH